MPFNWIFKTLHFTPLFCWVANKSFEMEKVTQEEETGIINNL